MRIIVAALIGIVASAATQPAFAATSVYTTLDFDKGCERVGDPPSQEDEDLGVLSLVCRGYKGYLVEYEQGDERTTVHYGAPFTTTVRAWESFAAFNTAAGKVEWRLDDKGVPFAAIHRFSIASGEQDSPAIKAPISGQVLVVSRVGQPNEPSGCAVGLVDALTNVDANELARKIADEQALKFRCGKDKPVYYGKRSQKASDFEIVIDGVTMRGSE